MGSYARTLLQQALEEPKALLNQKKFWKQDVFDLLLQHVMSQIGAAPAQALPLAQILPQFADLVSSSDGVLLVRSFAVLGSAYRAVGDFPESERSFQQAESQQVADIEMADVYRRKAYLRMEQGELEQAFHLVNKAIGVYRLEGDLFDRSPLGWSFIARGYFYHQAGRPGDALVDLSAAVGLVDHRIYPDFYYGALHNLSVLLVEHGNPRQVGTVLEQLNAAYRHFIGYSQRHLAKYKIRWLQGLAHIRFGAVRKAESNFIHARKGFAEVNAPLEFAVISLDLAGIYFDERRWGKLKEIASGTYRICERLSATREMLAALAFLGKAVQAEQLTHAVLRQAREQVLESDKPAGIRQDSPP